MEAENKRPEEKKEKDGQKRPELQRSPSGNAVKVKMKMSKMLRKKIQEDEEDKEDKNSKDEKE